MTTLSNTGEWRVEVLLCEEGQPKQRFGDFSYFGKLVLTLFLLEYGFGGASSCRTYYAGYGKGQARHRKCGQRNMNSRFFGEAVPVDTATTFVVQP